MKTFTRILGLVFLASFGFASFSQTLTVTNTSITENGYARANDFIVPLQNGIPIFDEDSCVNPAAPLTPNWIGADYGFLCDAKAREKKTTLPQSVASAQAFTMVKLDGDNSSDLKLDWGHVARSFTNSLEGYEAQSNNSLTLNITFQVAGLSPGTPVDVHYRYNTFAAGLTEHEGNDEDSVYSGNTLMIDGNDILGNTHNFGNPPGLSGWNERVDVTGVINTTAGANITIQVTSDLYSEIWLPGKPYGFGALVDQCVASFWGNIDFSVNPINPQGNGNVLGNGTVQFSVDIGSDSELSDPQRDGDEVFDPGDGYLISGSLLPTGGGSGLLDDAIPFGFDPSPTPPDPTYATAAPVGSGTFYSQVYRDFFDLDGLDNSGTQLSTVISPQLQTSIQPFNDQCIFEAQFLFFSFDDDSANHYLDANVGVPVTTLSPFSLDTFGKTPRKDEIVEMDFAPIYPTTLIGQFNIYDELPIHPNLPPNPDGGNPEDDDVDALDMHQHLATCGYWYFSPDHEAPAFDPNTNNILNWGSIYEVQMGGGFVEVVNPIVHLGLPDSTDVDAFEFAFIWDSTEQRLGLGLLFSVDDDDPYTPFDESGGLDPRVLYASYLNGTHFAYFPSPLRDDIDAISTYVNSLNGTSPGGPTGMNNPVQDFAWLKTQPNPFSSDINISYSLKKAGNMTLEVYDGMGRKVRQLANGSQNAGQYKLQWNGTDNNGSELADGIYHLRLILGTQEISKRVVKTR